MNFAPAPRFAGANSHCIRQKHGLACFCRLPARFFESIDVKGTGIGNMTMATPRHEENTADLQAARTALDRLLGEMSGEERKALLNLLLEATN